MYVDFVILVRSSLPQNACASKDPQQVLATFEIFTQAQCHISLQSKHLKGRFEGMSPSVRK